MLTQHIALVPEEDGVNMSELARVSAALQRQVTRDLAPVWGVAATVDAFPYLEDVPIGYWPVVLTFCELGRQSGVHLDANGQPYAQIQMSRGWSLAASRACLEMLVNPFASRTVTAGSLRSGQGPVEFMIEVSGPCADARNAYAINDVPVADFCTPAYFGGGAAHTGRHSFGGSLTAPLQVLPGGHLSWYDPATGHHWLRTHFGDNPIDSMLRAGGREHASLRDLLNACAPLCRPSDRQPRETMEERMEHARRASHVQAQRLRALLGARLDHDLAAEIVVARDRERDTPTLRTPPQLSAEPVEAESEEVDVAELEEIAEAEAAAVLSRQSAPTRELPTAPPLTPQRMAGSEPPLARGVIQSLAPIALEERIPGAPSGVKAKVALALAAAAAVAVIWVARTVPAPNESHAPPSALRQAAASPPARTPPPLAKTLVPAMEPAEPAAPIPSAVAAQAPPKPQVIATRVRQPTHRRRAERPTPMPAPAAAPPLAEPTPPPAALPARNEPAAPSIEDLIGSRR